jgi:putative transposase
MSRYRRSVDSSASYFFTVVTYRRQPILCEDNVRTALRNAIDKVRINRPFAIDAWVLLPDHIHCIWTLPDGDADFSTRWMLIKREVSLACQESHRRAEWITESKQKHRESTIWQRRFWEHKIRDDHDFTRHADYIHFNPVKHGYAPCVKEWRFSTFHRYVQEGVYPVDWGGCEDMLELVFD